MNVRDTIDKKLDEIVSEIRDESVVDSKYIAPRPPAPVSVTSEPIFYSDELNYMNRHWNTWVSESNYTSHRRFFGKYIVALKSKFQRYLFNMVFKEYFEREKVFTHNLVRFLNVTALYIDKRHDEMFYDLIKKIDAEANLINSRNDELFSELIKSIRHQNGK